MTTPQQDTLSLRINQGKPLTTDEQAQLVAIFGHGCRQHTKRKIAFFARCVPDVSHPYGIYGRVMIDKDGVSYCAGQSYPDEIRTVRDCMIGRG